MSTSSGGPQCIRAAHAVPLPVTSPGPATFAQVPAPGGGPHAPRGDPALVRSAFSLWAATALLGLLAVVMAWALLRAQRRRMLRRPARRRRRWIPSAWEEAGRRAEGITVDLDPPDAPPADGGKDRPR